MIIKNNFNERNVNPLNDYTSLGKTRENNIEKDNINLDQETKNIIDDIIRSDHEYDEENEDVRDKWDFFK